MLTTQRTSGDVVIVDLEGQLVAGTGDEQLNTLINQLLGDGHKKIVLNLASVRRVDSAGLGELVAGVQLAKRFQSAVRLVKPQESVRKVLEITRILPALDVHDSEDEAVAAFG